VSAGPHVVKPKKCSAAIIWFEVWHFRL